MSRWPARDVETFLAELRVVTAADSVSTSVWIRARSRADDGADPAAGDQPETARVETVAGAEMEEVAGR